MPQYLRASRHRLGCLPGNWQRAHTHALLGAALPLELDGAVGGGEERKIAATTDIGARVDAGAALAHDDGAGAHELAVVAFHAEHLGLAVAAITRTANALFMCHLKPILQTDGLTD